MNKYLLPILLISYWNYENSTTLLISQSELLRLFLNVADDIVKRLALRMVSTIQNV